MTTFRIAPPIVAAALALGALVLPGIASAQDVPSYAQPSGDETIHGRVVAIDGAFEIHVRDDRGFVDDVELHPGTIINPTGLSLGTGMSVTITGFNQGNTFAANEIDTPYDYAGPAPVPTYLGPGWWYPGFEYGYGPSFGLSLVFGGGGGYSFQHRPFAGRPSVFGGNGFAAGATSNGHAYRYPAGGARQTYGTGRVQSAPQTYTATPRTSRAAAPSVTTSRTNAPQRSSETPHTNATRSTGDGGHAHR